MAHDRPKTIPDLTRALNRAARDFHAREITLRYLPAPALTRWIATALLDHHRVTDKIRADIPMGELTLKDMERYADQPIARGSGDTPIDAVKAMTPLKWMPPRQG